MPFPGAKVPPGLTCVVPTVPVPASVPELPTVMDELGKAPLTWSVPAPIDQGSIALLVPVSVHRLVPVFWNMLKP